MSPRQFYLVRHKDLTGKSGEGIIAEGIQWSGGTAELHWLTDWETFVHWPGGVEEILAVHGHEGATVARWLDSNDLAAAYARVVPFLLHNSRQPLTCREHPDLPGRLRLTFRDEDVWRFWISLLDGPSFAAVHEEVDGEMQHRWTSPDGLIWLTYYSPLPSPTNDNDDPLAIFDKEDR